MGPRVATDPMTEAPHTSEFRDSLMEAGHNVRDAVAHAVPAAQEQLDRVGENIADQTRSLETYLTDCILDRPIGSMFVAAAVGVFVGAFLLRR